MIVFLICCGNSWNFPWYNNWLRHVFNHQCVVYYEVIALLSLVTLEIKILKQQQQQQKNPNDSPKEVCSFWLTFIIYLSSLRLRIVVIFLRVISGTCHPVFSFISALDKNDLMFVSLRHEEKAVEIGFLFK